LIDDSDDDSDADDIANEDEDDDDDDGLIDEDNDETLTDDDNSFNMKSLKKKHQQKHRSNKTKGYTSSPDSLLMQIHANNNNGYGIQTGSQHSSKPARIRTVLNEKQLHTLRTCYGANPRPDALMKEQLVEMTGLNPRVIRVWFQNKRCKDKKKNMLRPEGHGCHMMGGVVGGQPPHVQYQGQSGNHHLMFDHCF